MFIPLIVLAVAVIMICVEKRSPARPWPQVAGWWLRAVAFNGAQAALVLVAGLTLDPWVLEYRLWSADHMGVTTGTLFGYLATTFVYYWWHRWRHEVPLLWRWLHQIHHSAQRLEILTTFYKHPLEIAVNCLLTSVLLYLVLGLGPAAASGAILLAGLGELFYHWNFKTPHWSGYIFQRPESHCVHHEEGVHHYNYSDLPLWDMLFGTFNNPRQWQGRCGLGEGNEGRVIEMLAGVDVTAVKIRRAIEAGEI
ncbi:MAG TPA: sterol desaturase family protein [Pyrinomonadaceae bacterium]|nr:sterol desaturase family protein [Pyrinomonadaceae bacterium]